MEIAESLLSLRVSGAPGAQGSRCQGARVCFPAGRTCGLDHHASYWGEGAGLQQRQNVSGFPAPLSLTPVLFNHVEKYRKDMGIGGGFFGLFAGSPHPPHLDLLPLCRPACVCLDVSIKQFMPWQGLEALTLAQCSARGLWCTSAKKKKNAETKNRKVSLYKELLFKSFLSSFLTLTRIGS